jgi:hypothetical protein
MLVVSWEGGAIDIVRVALGRHDDFNGGKRWKIVAGGGNVVILDVR